MEEMLKYLRALVFLQMQGLTESATFSKPELLLFRAGFNHKEIGEFLGKNPPAVRMAISRALKAQGKGDGGE